jgi:NAD(P)-dependent dehydrogenase (short-subunit alcohol dehydrogenase family)
MSKEKRLAGRVALVTGGARGIGGGIARRLSEEGAAVVVADIDDGEARSLAATLAGAVAHGVDIADASSVERLAAFIGASHGRLDILVNNAAILDATPLADLTMGRYRRVIEVNLNGALQVTMAAVPLLRATGRGGRILNIASIMGIRGARDALAYSTAKGGVVNMTRCLACDLAPDAITVNAICPGFINTRMALLPDGSGHEHETDWFKDIYIKYRRIPLARAGLPDDIAGPAFFLCSDDSAYVTGQTLLVDGGVSATF